MSETIVLSASDDGKPSPPDPITMAEMIRHMLANVNRKAVANALNMSEPHIAQLLKLLDFPLEIQQAIRDRSITFTHAQILRQCVPVEDWLKCRSQAQQDWPLFKKFVSETYGFNRKYFVDISNEELICQLQYKIEKMQKAATSQDNYTRQYLGGKVDMANELIAMLRK